MKTPRYFVSHILNSDALLFAERIGEKVQDQFAIPKLSDKGPLHVTLKAPFHTTEDVLDAYKRDLQSRVMKFEPLNIVFDSLREFENSSQRVLYLHVVSRNIVTRLVREVQRSFLEIVNQELVEYEYDPVLHASIVREKYDDGVREYVQELYYNDAAKPLKSNLEAIAVLRSDGTHPWQVLYTIPLGTTKTS